ncbi:MAG: hypothetical protein VX670_05400 [Candidatus Latescibacterota bacterium]|nr:hypothetical protein [Candidatus Latescibacterota bacterium]MEE2627904.1 hypothetical protein [Candidatus Latescibacterota bacterium]MEE2728200.1 hypothetical protein [Candidatus Latescibacterota bacterium]
MTEFLLTLLIVLIIVCLVVRDQNELTLSKMRANLLNLRTEEKRMEDTRVEVEQLVRWFSETLNRTSSRQRTAEQYCRELEDMLEGAGIEVSVRLSDSADEKS